MPDRLSSIAAAIASTWGADPISTLAETARVSRAVRVALNQRGLVPTPEERLYANERAAVRHHIMDAQKFVQSEIISGAWLMDVAASRGYLDAVLPSIIPEVPDA